MKKKLIEKKKCRLENMELATCVTQDPNRKTAIERKSARWAASITIRNKWRVKKVCFAWSRAEKAFSPRSCLARYGVCRSAPPPLAGSYLGPRIFCLDLFSRLFAMLQCDRQSKRCAINDEIIVLCHVYVWHVATLLSYLYIEWLIYPPDISRRSLYVQP